MSVNYFALCLLQRSREIRINTVRFSFKPMFLIQPDPAVIVNIRLHS